MNRNGTADQLLDHLQLISVAVGFDGRRLLQPVKLHRYQLLQLGGYCILPTHHLSALSNS